MVGQHSWIAVYILASGRNGTLYTGVTSKLRLRVEQHKLGTFEDFSTQKVRCRGCSNRSSLRQPWSGWVPALRALGALRPE